MNLKSNGALLTVLLIVFIDILGFTIMIPLLPFYAESLGASAFTVGMLSSIYGLCSLVAGPILGELSDLYGRRIVLLLSQIGTFIGFVILGLSNTLWVVFLSRFIDGITAGNITVAQAYISDVTEPENRTRAMGMIGASFGLGFILGPAISGILVHYSQSAPIWASAALSFISIIGTIIFLKDVKRNNEITKYAGIKNGIKDQLKKYISLLNTPILKECFSIFFIFSISFSLYMSGLALYCERVLLWHGHPFTAKEVGILLSYIGIIALVVPLFMMGFLVRQLGEIKIMLLGFLLTAMAFLVIGFSPLLSIFLVGITINTFGNAIIRPAISGTLSQNAGPQNQGLIFGVCQTLMSIAQIICPLISGFLLGKKWTLFWSLTIFGISILGIIVGKIASTKIDKNRLMHTNKH